MKELFMSFFMLSSSQIAYVGDFDKNLSFKENIY